MNSHCSKEFSGLRVNLQKTNILPIGNIANTQPLFRSIYHWTTEPIKVLGIMIHPDIELMKEINYSPLLQKVRDTIMMWRYRTISIMGKI